ncbi:type II toxin-antitoxin system VapC family toxin [Microlunatus sp. GCM10028923]|uniref:type II toxin-antitoxin system VapC family toxin n=1 Tax=Microlunatus sp. GCM10028923 TaxID=3273400 RepID=UPI00361A5238
MIILDTNVVSELMKPIPDLGVAEWVRREQRQFYVTTITVAEVFYGLERLPAGRRRRHLEETAEDLFEDFAEFILPFDFAAGRGYGRLVATREARGRPISTEDAQIAAICLTAGMACATRNTGDFEGIGVELINPWEEGSSSGKNTLR